MIGNANAAPPERSRSRRVVSRISDTRLSKMKSASHCPSARLSRLGVLTNQTAASPSPSGLRQVSPK